MKTDQAPQAAADTPIRAADFRRAVHNAHGDTIDEKMLDLFTALYERAILSDVPAAKLLLDHLCDPIPTRIELHHSGRVLLPDLGEEQVKRVAEMLEKAGNAIARMQELENTGATS